MTVENPGRRPAEVLWKGAGHIQHRHIQTERVRWAGVPYNSTRKLESRSWSRHRCVGTTAQVSYPFRQLTLPICWCMTFFTSISCGAALGAVAMEDIEVKYDAKEQKSYYYNRRTSKAGWSIEDVKGAQAAEAPPPPPGGGGGAADHSHIEERHDTERRRSYFYNKQTGKSGWSKEEVPPAPQLLFSDTCTHVLRDEPELTCLTPTRAGWASRGRSRGRPSPGKRVSRPPGGTGMLPQAARSRARPYPSRPPSSHGLPPLAPPAPAAGPHSDHGRSQPAPRACAPSAGGRRRRRRRRRRGAHRGAARRGAWAVLLLQHGDGKIRLEQVADSRAALLCV